MHCHTLVLSIQHFFRTRISHTPLTIQHPKLECGCTPWNEFLVRNPCLCTRLVDFTTVLFFRGVDQALFSQFCSFRPNNGLNIFCCELTSTVQTLGALIIMESFDDDVYSMRGRTQCVPLKLLVCTFFLSSLIATHSCKCFLRVLLNPGKPLFKHIAVHLIKDIPLHATVSFQKAKKNLFFFLDAINFSQSFTVTQISVSFLPTSQQRVRKYKNKTFFGENEIPF